MGAKAISIYRDGSKRTQPLNTGKDKLKDEVQQVVESMGRPVRRRLSDERMSITHKFDIAGHEGYITVGLFEDGTPGELFLVMAKEGSTISGSPTPSRRRSPTRCSSACRSRCWWTSSATRASSRPA
jgi:ribonucleoside-diphosphate reductase alpha chain